MEYNFRVIGERIREMRKNQQLNQDDFIEKLKELDTRVSRNTLSSIENGVEKSFTLQFLLACCQVFNCDIGYLMGEYGDGKTRNTQFIHDETGLSESSIARLSSYRSYDSGKIRLEIIDYLLSETDFSAFLMDQINHCYDKYVEYQQGCKQYSNAVKSIDELTKGNILTKIEKISSGEITQSITRHDLATSQNLKDAAFFNAQRSFADILDNLVEHFYQINEG